MSFEDKSQRVWGGRFRSAPSTSFMEFTASFAFDRALLRYDIRASRAWALALVKATVLSEGEARQLSGALEELEESFDSTGEKVFEGFENSEDVHSYLESYLVSKVGDVAKKLHTGRSRNDQVVTALRLWLRDQVDGLHGELRAFEGALVKSAQAHAQVALPGYTHLQRAQPVSWAHWCLAYFEMFKRDEARLEQVRKSTNVMPLGSGALAGTAFTVDRQALARSLGFDAITQNSLDAVSDRDFALEFAFTCSTIASHLSRFAEDMVLYSTREFGFVELSDGFSSGSSLMPQKKNPDAFELIRGKTGRVYGHLTALLTLTKGLPLAYNRDLQEDKEPLFDLARTIGACIEAARLAFESLTLNTEICHNAAQEGYLNATELADYLVRKGLRFRDAHELAGKLVLKALERGCELQDLPLGEYRSESALIESDVFDALSVESALARKSQEGGTSPIQVQNALKRARTHLSRAKGDQT